MNTWFIWIMFVLSRSIYASFSGTTKFLSTSAISGMPSLSLTSHASMIVLNGQVDFWIINQCRICKCVMYPYIRWSRGHIPFGALLSGVLSWVSNLTVSYEIFVIGIDIYLCPHNIPLNSFWLRVLVWKWCLLIVRQRVSTNIHNRPVILNVWWRWCIYHKGFVTSG